MKHIRKTNPPTALSGYLNKCKKAGQMPSYENCTCLDEWSEVLLKEQGFLCAYTMMRISKGRSNMKREHFKPQNGEPNNDLDHWNLFAVCMGNEGMPFEHQYADSRKGKTPLPYKLYPANPDLERWIKYRANGEIYSDDPEVLEAIGEPPPSVKGGILNLNYQELIDARKAAYEKTKQELNKLAKGDSWRLQDLKDIIDRLQKRNMNGEFFEYCSFVLFRLKKELSWRIKK